MKPGEISDLASSIAKVGLLHPPVLAPVPGLDRQLRLVAGERRLTAMTSLHDSDTTFSCGNHIVPQGQTPFLLLSDLSDTELLEAELEENIMRVDLVWQDRTQALARIHAARVAINPEQTISATAKELVERDGTGKNFDHTREQIARSQILMRHMDDPEIANARDQKEAWSKLSKKASNTLIAEMARRKGNDSVPHRLIHGDAFEELAKLPAESFDLVLTDPPYGYDANKGWARQVQAAHHYDDSPEAATSIAELIIREGFRLTKPRANLLMFCHHEAWYNLREYAKCQGWTPWPRPIIWHKSNEGLAPWGSQGFRYCYEMILYATKGQRGLLRPMPDVIHVYKITRGKTHGAQKPTELFQKLIETSCLPGEAVLDPCAGSGTIFPAATAAKCVATGIEKEKQYADIAQTRLDERPDNDDRSSSVQHDSDVAKMDLEMGDL